MKFVVLLILLANFAAADFPIVSSRSFSPSPPSSSSSSATGAGTGELEKNAVPTADNEDGTDADASSPPSPSSSSGATIGPPSATVYLFLGVGLTLPGRYPPPPDLGNAERPLGGGLLAIVLAGGDIARGIVPDAEEEEIGDLLDECGMAIPTPLIPSPAPNPAPVPLPVPLGSPGIESGRVRVAGVSDDGGECVGENVPSDGDA